MKLVREAIEKEANMPYAYANQCTNKEGMPGDHLAEGKLISPEGKVVCHQCRKCAQVVIDEYWEKMGWVWTFEPYPENVKESVLAKDEDIYQSVVTSEEIPKSECDRAHWRRVLKRQLRGLGYSLTEYVNSVEWLQAEIIKLGAEPFKPCFARKGLGSVCMLPADGHTEHKYSQYGQQEQEEFDLRYPEENSTRETPLRIGTKRIKINGIEFPFVAVLDPWVPALLHDNRMVWIRHYRAIEGLRIRVFKVYYATGKVPYNRLPWAVDNQSNGQEYRTLIEAVNAALLIAQEKEIELERSNAASLLGRQGGLVKSEKKARAAKENGKKGGRKKVVMDVDTDEL